MSANIVNIYRKGETQCHVQAAGKFKSVSSIQEALEFIEGLKSLLSVDKFDVTIKEVICGVRKDMVYIDYMTV